MNIVIIIFGILFLKGYDVGRGLAICSIIEGSIITLAAIIKRVIDD